MAWIRTLQSHKKLLAITLVVLGGVLISVFSWRSVRAYQQWQYIQEQGLDQGDAHVGAIRAWMTLRYVGVAYAVPQEYIFAELAIPYNRRNSNDTLGHLAHFYAGSADQESGSVAIIVAKVGSIIQAYRANPVAMGLKDIRPWMSLQYIANSTGIPVAYLLNKLQISAANNNNSKPLNDLAEEVHFKGGVRRLIDTLKQSLNRYQDEQ